MIVGGIAGSVRSVLRACLIAISFIWLMISVWRVFRLPDLLILRIILLHTRCSLLGLSSLRVGVVLIVAVFSFILVVIWLRLLFLVIVLVCLWILFFTFKMITLLFFVYYVPLFPFRIKCRR